MAAENAGTDLSLATQSFAPFAVVPHCELETCQPMTSPEGFRDTVAISSSSLAATSATHGSGTAAAVPTTTTAAGSEALTFRSESERRQFGNKLSQRRFRERRKARTETLEAALLQSAAELRHVQAMQTALRLRNQLLEKMVQLNKQAEPKSLPDYPPSKMTVLDLYKQQGFETVADPLNIPIQNVPYLRLTIWQTAAQMISVQGAGKLALHDVANIHTAYTHQMAACLAHLSDEGLTDESNSPAMQRLLDMSIEHGSLLAIIAMSNPGAFKDIQNCKLDEGVVCLDARAPSFYYNIVAAMQLTDSQWLDVLFLKQLFYYKLGQLARKRKALLSNMTHCKMEASHVSDTLAETTRWSNQLRENGAEEHCAYHRYVIILYRGIFTCKQLATAQVFSFPWFPASSKVLEAEAVRRGEPPMQSYLEDRTTDDLQHAANWAEAGSYLETITLDSLNVHVPFLKYMLFRCQGHAGPMCI